MTGVDLSTYIGDIGTYQWIIFAVVFVFNLFDGETYHIVFVAADMPHWCRVPALDDLPYDVQKNVAIPVTESSDGSITYNSCEMYSLNYSVYNNSQLFRFNRSLMISNETEVIQCEEWTYDQSQFTSTIVKKVRKNINCCGMVRCLVSVFV